MSGHSNRSESWSSLNVSCGYQNEELCFINKETVDVILNSKFLNCISINESNCKDVYVASRYLNVEELVMPSTEFFRRHLSVGNCLAVFFFAYKWKDALLMTAAADFFYDYFASEESFLTLELGKLLQFFAFSGRNQNRKEIVFQSICRWIIFNKPRNLNLINQILKCLAFPYSESYIYDCIRCMPQLKKNYFCKHFMKQVRLNNLCPSLPAHSIDMTTIYNEKMKNHFVVVGQSIMKINDEPHAKYRPIIEYFCPAQQIWTILDYFPKDIREYQSLISQNRIYVAGGYYYGEDPSLEVWFYDIETEKWRELNPMPHHLSNFGFLELNNFLYIVGGKTTDENLKSTIWQYDLEDHHWSVVGNLEYCAMDPAVLVYGQRILIAGGATANSPKGTKYFRCFDPLNRTWDELPSLLSKKTGASICEYDGRYIYVFGGRDSRRVDCFNTKIGAWSKALAMKKTRAKAGVLIIGQFIYLAGGQKGKRAYRKSIERLDIIKHKWKIIGSMSSRGAGIACSYVPATSTDCGRRLALPVEDVKQSIRRSSSLK